MKALITGITGQDGAYLASFLLHKGYEVVGIAPRRASPNYWRLEELGLIDDEQFVENFSVHHNDITCPASVTSLIEEGQFDEIYNLAAQSFVTESFNSPVSTFNINSIGVLHLLEAIRRHSHKSKFYQASTSEMFGLVDVEGQNEKTTFHPRSPYGVAKAAAHYAVQNYREAYGLHASCGILFNHESPLRGEEFVTRKVTKAVARIVVEKQDKLYLGNTTAKRDWGHAVDYVYGMWLMLQQNEPDDYVLATGETHTVQDMVNIAFNRVGLDSKNYVVSDDLSLHRPSDIPLLCGDASKAHEILGWYPSVNLEALIHQMVDADLSRENVDVIKMLAETGTIRGETFNATANR